MVEIEQLGNERSLNYAVTLAITSAVISGKKHRKSYVIRNTSTAGEVISLSLANETIAVAGSGIVLNPNEYIADSNSGTYKCWSGDIQALATAATATLAVTEVI